ncbi:MAG: PA2817 family protein [Pseudomonadota bacterium]
MATNDLNHNLALLDLLRSILVAVGDAEQIPEESHALFMTRFDELKSDLLTDPVNSQYLGQDIMCQVIERYPQIAHLVPRDLLWFFGGACFNFLADEELDMYEALEERRYEAEQNDEPFDWNQEKQLMALPITDDSTQH